MEQPTQLPRIAFVIDLGPKSSRWQRQLVRMFESQRIETTWTVSHPSTAAALREQAAVSASNIALKLEASADAGRLSQSRYTAWLSSELSALSGVLGQTPTTVVGDSQALRSRRSVFAQLGIRVVVNEGTDASAGTKPRALSFGLWQLSPTTKLSRRPLLQRLLRRGTSLLDIMAAAIAGTALVAIDSQELERGGARQSQMIERLLREVAKFVVQQQIQVCSVSEIACDLDSRKAMKPQQSIMRMAA